MFQLENSIEPRMTDDKARIMMNSIVIFPIYSGFINFLCEIILIWRVD